MHGPNPAHPHPKMFRVHPPPPAQGPSAVVTFSHVLSDLWSNQNSVWSANIVERFDSSAFLSSFTFVRWWQGYCIPLNGVGRWLFLSFCTKPFTAAAFAYVQSDRRPTERNCLILFDLHFMQIISVQTHVHHFPSSNRKVLSLLPEKTAQTGNYTKYKSIRVILLDPWNRE